MPVFQCPRCGKQQLVPLAFCESFLSDVPVVKPEGRDDFVHLVTCPECAAAGGEPDTPSPPVNNRQQTP
jgi:hypothetical protein